ALFISVACSCSVGGCYFFIRLFWLCRPLPPLHSFPTRRSSDLAKIFPADRADYALASEDVDLAGFNDTPLNTLSDSLNLSFVIRNIGRVDLDSIDIKVTRQLPDGTVIPYDPLQLAPIFRRDTVSFTIPNTWI